MANYGYINLDGCPSDFEAILKAAVLETLGPQWKVEHAHFNHDGETWLVTLPNTKRYPNTPPGEDLGFMVALGDRQLLFRHGPQVFERWAQGRVEEQLADHFGKPCWYDATNQEVPPGTRRYRVGNSFRDYLERNLLQPLSLSDHEWVKCQLEYGPPEGTRSARPR